MYTGPLVVVGIDPLVVEGIDYRAAGYIALRIVEYIDQGSVGNFGFPECPYLAGLQDIYPYSSYWVSPF